MSSKRKLPRIPRLKPQSTPTTTTTPITAQDYLEQATTNEESGDRWLGSDIPKALRFYQKAHVAYLTSLHLGTSPDPETVYNSARLMFHVWNLFKDGNIIMDEIPELNVGSDSVVVGLDEIVRVHESAVNVSVNTGGKVDGDLLYNLAVVYTELLDDDGGDRDMEMDEVVGVYMKASKVFEELIGRQCGDLERFVGELNEIDGGGSSSGGNGNGSPGESKQEEEEYESGEVIQPVDIYDTVLAGYKLIQSVYEHIQSDSQIDYINQLTAELLQLCDNTTSTLIDNFSIKSPHPMLENLSQDHINELIIAKTLIIGLTYTDIFQVIDLWKQNPTLPDIPERYMIASDNIQTILDRHDISISNYSNSEMVWKCLSEQTNFLKSAQELLNQQITTKRKSPTGLGTLIAQLSGVIIARADIDLQRSQITGYEPAEKNKEVLVNNCRNLLKSAMNIANSNGGLRELAMEKLQREKKKSESVFRLCLIENKSSIEELDKILTRKRWINEVNGIKRLGYYDVSGIQTLSLGS
ncbi:uncharacterized protein J8A68_005676 [[Candida] subhashii]|uniref:Uncharacterized protein n=1 Tax=[Candida] subhashii TaxID=561895 RepID=A0A8J5UV79_9ASCO|nr:uncharacterized protein J8A68_005676 [[Candida] subhashii]KAG7660859.1 hypothetical protein J8A68_005676 [[Candida] subhashii]